MPLVSPHILRLQSCFTCGICSEPKHACLPTTSGSAASRLRVVALPAMPAAGKALPSLSGTGASRFRYLQPGQLHEGRHEAGVRHVLQPQDRELPQLAAHAGEPRQAVGDHAIGSAAIQTQRLHKQHAMPAERSGHQGIELTCSQASLAAACMALDSAQVTRKAGAGDDLWWQVHSCGHWPHMQSPPWLCKTCNHFHCSAKHAGLGHLQRGCGGGDGSQQCSQQAVFTHALAAGTICCC